MTTIRTSQSVSLNLVKACTEMKTWLLAWVLPFCLAAFYILGKSGGLQFPHCKCGVVVQRAEAYSRFHANKVMGRSRIELSWNVRILLSFGMLRCFSHKNEVIQLLKQIYFIKTK